MFNLARFFSYTRHVEHELRRERDEHAETRRKAEDERQKFIDYMARAAGKSPVFERPEPPKQQPSRSPVFGPTMSARAQAEREKDEAQKRGVVTPSNGHRVDAPVIPPE